MALVGPWVLQSPGCPGGPARLGDLRVRVLQRVPGGRWALRTDRTDFAGIAFRALRTLRSFGARGARQAFGPFGTRRSRRTGIPTRAHRTRRACGTACALRACGTGIPQRSRQTCRAYEGIGQSIAVDIRRSTLGIQRVCTHHFIQPIYEAISIFIRAGVEGRSLWAHGAHRTLSSCSTPTSNPCPALVDDQTAPHADGARMDVLIRDVTSMFCPAGSERRTHEHPWGHLVSFIQRNPDVERNVLSNDRIQATYGTQLHDEDAADDGNLIETLFPKGITPFRHVVDAEGHLVCTLDRPVGAKELSLVGQGRTGIRMRGKTRREKTQPYSPKRNVLPTSPRPSQAR